MNPIRQCALLMALSTCLLTAGALSLEHSFDGHNFKRVASLDLPEVRFQPEAVYIIHNVRTSN